MTPSFIECIIKAHTHPPHLSIPPGKTIWSCSLFWVIFTYEESLEKYNFVVSKRDMIYIFVKKNRVRKQAWKRQKCDIKCMICCRKRQDPTKQNFWSSANIISILYITSKILRTTQKRTLQRRLKGLQKS